MGCRMDEASVTAVSWEVDVSSRLEAHRAACSSWPFPSTLS
jgi:hypothetical protein